MTPTRWPCSSPETGGGCRASNYIHLLAQGAGKSGPGLCAGDLGESVRSGEKSRFSLTLPIIRKMVYAMMYGDIIVNVANQVRPYERERGATDAMVSTWQGRLIQGFQQGKGMSRGQMRTNFDAICADFAPSRSPGSRRCGWASWVRSM